jgi:hypothetical protein
VTWKMGSHPHPTPHPTPNSPPLPSHPTPRHAHPPPRVAAVAIAAKTMQSAVGGPAPTAARLPACPLVPAPTLLLTAEYGLLPKLSKHGVAPHKARVLLPVCPALRSMGGRGGRREAPWGVPVGAWPRGQAPGPTLAVVG